MKKTYNRIPRKIKKGLKSQILKGTSWRSKDCKIRGIVKSPHRVFNRTRKFAFKGFAVQAYTLGY